jgi:GT2 family glycosyltransferase
MSDRQFTAQDVTVAIPTFGRDQVLLDTIHACLRQEAPAGEVLIVDQTPVHDRATEEALSSLRDSGRIRWERMTTASQPAAMNTALRVAANPLLLFLDDDIEPGAGFISAHAQAHNDFDAWVVVGQIIQPWQTPSDVVWNPSSQSLKADFDFPFHSTHACWLQNAMSGHMSVRHEQAMRIGGFDENFKGAAYRFDTEFAKRVIRSGGRIRFCPEASIRHLRVERGGTRIRGNHLASPSPHHGVGDYYYAMLQGWSPETVRYMSRRAVREVATRFHLRHPWYMPVKLVGEARAFLWALELKRQGPALIHASNTAAADVSGSVDVQPTVLSRAPALPMCASESQGQKA